MTRNEFIDTLTSSGFATYDSRTYILNAERMGIRRIAYNCPPTGNYFRVTYFFTDGFSHCFRGSYSQSWLTPEGHLQTHLNEF